MRGEQRHRLRRRGRCLGKGFDVETGGRLDVDALAASLAWMAGLADDERQAMGRRAASVVADWGPERFADGMMEAIDRAEASNGFQQTAADRALVGRESR